MQTFLKRKLTLGRCRTFTLLSICILCVWAVFVFNNVGNRRPHALSYMNTIGASVTDMPYTRDAKKPRRLQHELARYEVERIYKRYLQYVRGELHHIKDKLTSDEAVTARDDLLFLTQERSMTRLAKEVAGGLKQAIPTHRRNILHNLLLVKQHAGTQMPALDRLILDTEALERILEENIRHMTTWSDEWKKEASSKLSEIVQRKIHQSQNPADCAKSRLLYCRWDQHCGAGFGCHVHHIAYCLLMAFSLNRTLIFDTKGWPYPGTLSKWFQPLGSCTEVKGLSINRADGKTIDQDNSRILSLPRIQLLNPHSKFAPLAIPDKIADEILHFNRFPPVWWIGQFVHYALRPSKQLEEMLGNYTQAIGFKYPIVGVHVRRTDKLSSEAKAIPLEKYMSYVTRWYEDVELTSPNVTRRVFLATDEPKVLKEALQKYPEYRFIRIDSPVPGIRGRSSIPGLRDIVLDLLFLSRANYTVCTHSSNVCRVIYELMQPQADRGDGSAHVQSLDDIYMYDLWGRDNHTVKVIIPHKAIRPEEHDLDLGDEIRLVADNWNGTSRGRILKGEHRVTFPSYKVKDIFRTVKLPVSFHDGR